MQTALIWAIHRTQDWWTHVGHAMGFQQAFVATERKGVGDCWVSDDFYAAYARQSKRAQPASSLMDDATCADVIARCRVLRWLPANQARAMVFAMAEAAEKLLDKTRPDVFVCFTIDNYVSDLIARRARLRGVPCFEVTASALPGMAMLMHRGRLITTQAEPSRAAIDAAIAAFGDPLFVPSYVRRKRQYTLFRFLRIVSYFRLRGWVFRLWSFLKRDPLRFHLLEAGLAHGHRVDWADRRMLGLVHGDWRDRIAAIPPEKRAFFGLQLIPEAAIDYWIEDLRLVRHEAMIIEVAHRLSEAGYVIVVKDHPLQFGFRQTALLEALLRLPGTIIVPYDVSGNELLRLCAVSVTATGTLGMQAALAGKRSIVADAYYATAGDFVSLHAWEDIASIASAVALFRPDATGVAARIVGQLLRGSFSGDFFSFQNFNAKRPSPAATALGNALGERIRALGPDGEDWHMRNMPHGGGRFAGSPLG